MDRKFFLYRIKFIRRGQTDAFDDNAPPSQIFSEAITEKPSIKFTHNVRWKIGNIFRIGNRGGKFAVGRITNALVEKFNEESDDFFEGVDNIGPFATVYFDIEIGLMAIEGKSKVNSHVGQTAKRIESIFDNSKAVNSRGVYVTVEEISDPEGFVEKIRKASHVLRFQASFTGPNPNDADALFQKPLSVYAGAINAAEGNVTVSGKNLDKNVVINVARSSAATANKVHASIISDGKRKVIKFIKGPKRLDAARNASDIDIFNEVISSYKKVKADEENTNIQHR